MKLIIRAESKALHQHVTQVLGGMLAEAIEINLVFRDDVGNRVIPLMVTFKNVISPHTKTYSSLSLPRPVRTMALKKPGPILVDKYILELKSGLPASQSEDQTQAMELLSRIDIIVLDICSHTIPN